MSVILVKTYTLPSFLQFLLPLFHILCPKIPFFALVLQPLYQVLCGDYLIHLGLVCFGFQPHYLSFAGGAENSSSLECMCTLQYFIVCASPDGGECNYNNNNNIYSSINTNSASVLTDSFACSFLKMAMHPDTTQSSCATPAVKSPGEPTGSLRRLMRNQDLVA